MAEAAVAATLKFIATAAAKITVEAVVVATIKVAALAGVNAVIANQNKPRPQGGLINLTINPNEPRRLQIGTRANGGVLADWYIRGSKNQYLYMIVYLGEGPMGRITKVYGGGRVVYSAPINHGTRTVIPNYRSGGDRLWITYYDGRPGQTADSYLVSQGVGWTSNHVGAGCAYAIVEAWWDSDNQTTPPQITFEMEGAKLYDRRLDTTAGGSGSHRANDPATWALSTNPAVALDHYLLGRYTGAVKTFGVGLAAADVPYAAFAARANLADENVNRKVSGTLKRYAANGFLFADRSYSDTIRDLCRAMNARPADFGGRIGVIDGEEKTPVMTLADADVIDAVPESYTPKRSWADLVSVVRGTYQNPAQLYQSGEYPRVTDAAWTAQDGGSPKEATLDLEMETDVERAQRLATLFARRQRRQAQLTGTYALRTIELEQGDWFIRAGGIFGAGKTFEVIDRVLDPRSMTVTLTAFEVDPADSAWVPSTAVDAPPDPISNTDTLQAMEVPSLTVTGVTLSGAVADLPAIRVQWTAPDDPRVRQIVVEAVPTAGGFPVSQTADVSATQVVFTNGITDDTDYLVRARFIGNFIPSAFTGNIAVTTLGDYSVGVATSVPWSGLTGEIPAAVDNALVPVGSNAIGNSEYYAGIDGWVGSQDSGNTATMSLRVPGNSWAMPTRGTLMVYQADASTAGYFDVRWRPRRSAVATSYALKVQPGEQVAAAVHASAHRCVVQLRIEWRDAAGTVLSYTAAAENNATFASSTEPDAWPRLTRLGIAPASAAWAEIHIRKNPTLSGSSDSFMFLHKPMLTRIPATQAVVPDYTPGVALDVFGRADPTATNTAAAIAGQGAFATINSAAYGSALLTGFGGLSPLNFTTLGAGGLVRRQDGVTALTDAAAVTSLGTAAAIAGQGAFATISSIDDNRANSNNLLRRSAGGLFSGDLAATLGARAGTNLFRTDGVSVLTQADVRTPEGTAAAIAGQGWGATASEAAANNALIPLGQNLLNNSDYTQNLLGWTDYYNTTTLGYTPGRALSTDWSGEPVITAFATVAGTPAIGTEWNAVQILGFNNLPLLQRWAPRITGGERYYIAAYVGAHRCKARLVVFFFDAAGNAFDSTAFDSATNTFLFSRGRIENAQRIGGFVTAPANARFAIISIKGIATGGANPYVFAGWAMMSRASPTQTAAPQYNSGPNDRHADETAGGTAGAIAGQGPGATATAANVLNTNIATRGLLSARPGAGAFAGQLYYATDTGQQFEWTGAAWALRADITAQAQLSLSATSQSVTVNCDNAGTPAAGQLPRTVGLTLKLGNTVVSQDAAWAIVSAGGATATVDDTVSVSAGNLTVTALPSDADVIVSATYGGVTLRITITFHRQLAPPPVSGGSGGTSASDTSIVDPGSTSFVVVSDVLTVTTGSGGQVRLVAVVDYLHGALVNRNIIGRWQRNISGTYTDVGTEITGSNSNTVIDSESGGTIDTYGTLSIDQTITGLGAATSQSFRLRTRRSGGTVWTVYGTATAIGS